MSTILSLECDVLLRFDMSMETHIIGCDDDVATLIVAKRVEQAQHRLEMGMLKVNGGITGHSLSLALIRTEIKLVA